MTLQTHKSLWHFSYYQSAKDIISEPLSHWNTVHLLHRSYFLFKTINQKKKREKEYNKAYSGILPPRHGLNDK